MTRTLATLGPRLALVAALMLAAMPATAGDVQPFARGSWGEILDGHKGRPLIVHLWGVTCAPCRLEMPEWGKLIRGNPAAPIVMLHAERMPPDARIVDEMLDDAGLAAADNWAFADAMLARLRYEIDPKWLGELPMTLLIGADGTRKTIVGSADMAEVEAWIATQADAARAPPAAK